LSFEKFNIDLELLGKIRKKYLERIQNDLSSILDLQSLYAPITKEEEKRGLGKKVLLGKSDSEKQKERYIMISALVKNLPFDHIIGFLSPIKMSSGMYLEEYTYTTLVPFPCDTILFYVEEKGGLTGGTKGFFAFPQQLNLPILNKDELIQSNSDSSLGFTLSQTVQSLRMQLTLSKDIKQLVKSRSNSFVSTFLNQSINLPPLIKKLDAIHEAKKFGIKISNKYGVTTILIPNGSSTLIQIGDFGLNPIKAIDVLNELTLTLKLVFDTFKNNPSG
jgi:hypothetical protein